MMGQQRTSSSAGEPPTIGVLTALPKEFAAVRVMLDDPKQSFASGGTPYLLGTIPAANGGRHHIVAGLLSDMANNQAAVASINMLRDFPSLSEIVFVGIAGAVPNPADVERHVRLGDIVVSGREGIIQHDLGKHKAGKLQTRAPPRPASSRFLTAMQHLKADLLGSSALALDLDRGAHLWNSRRPSPETDRLKATPPAEGWLENPVDPHRIDGEPRVFSGAIASGNTVLKGAVHRDQLRDELAALAIEMEGSGLADAAHVSNVPCFVIRGTCDYSDEEKNDIWQEYAALIAAAFLRRLLSGMAEISRESSSDARLGTMRWALQRCLDANTMTVWLYAGMGLLMAGCGMAVCQWFFPSPDVWWTGAPVGVAAVGAPLYYRGRLEWVLGRLSGARSFLRQIEAVRDDALLLIQQIQGFLEGCVRKCRHG
jgi:nucleoside phosphorylase